MERLLAIGTLGDLLEQAPSLTDATDGLYGLYVPEDEQSALDEHMLAAFILFLTDDPDDFLPEAAKERNFVMIADLQTVQDVIEVARGVYPNASRAYLAKALAYFLNHDAYIE